MKDKIKMYKELAFVYIINGKKFLCKKKAERYLEKVNKDAKM
tara:strand:- start:13914 stop:14039 length:126 start_codon:yes stop_codon:yes gene_type:complete